MLRIECRFCRSRSGQVVLDLERQPTLTTFPMVDDPGPEPTFPPRMWLCADCGLAQLVDDEPAVWREPAGGAPAAPTAQRHDDVAQFAAAGVLPFTGTVTSSPARTGKGGTTSSPPTGWNRRATDCLLTW